MNRLTHLKTPKRLLQASLCLWFCGGIPGYAASDFDQPVSPARIEALVAKAKAALKENRLTVPSGNNAVGYAQQVLNLSPGHPEAQRILRAVVDRYETLGAASLDRADALWQAEIDKAQILQRRGSEVARNYRLPDNTLAKIEERVANARKLRLNAAAEITASVPADRPDVAGMIERYLDLSEEASSQGAFAESESHLNVSRDLMTRYNLAEADRDRLSRHVTHAERELASRRTAYAGQSSAVSRATESARYVLREQRFFMPPSF